MTKKTKAVNYSSEDIEQLVAGYNPDADQDTRIAQVDALVKAMGRKKTSIVAKLVNLDLYVKLSHVSKDGTKPMSKEDRVTEIADTMGIDSDVIGSLSKANVGVVKMFQDLVNSSQSTEANLAAVMSTVAQYFTGDEAGDPAPLETPETPEAAE